MKASVRGRAKFRQDTLDTLSRLLRWSICIMAAAVFTPLWELHIMTFFQYLPWFSSGLVQFYCDIGSILSFWHPWWWGKIKKNSLHPASTFWDQRSLRPTFLLQMERVLVAAMQLGSMKHLDVMSAGNVVAMPCFQVLCGEVSNHQRRIGALPWWLRPRGRGVLPRCLHVFPLAAEVLNRDTWGKWLYGIWEDTRLVLHWDAEMATGLENCDIHNVDHYWTHAVLIQSKIQHG